MACVYSLDIPFDMERVKKHLENGGSPSLIFYLQNEKKIPGTEVPKMTVTDSNHQSSDHTNTEPPIPAAETTTNLYYLCINLFNVYCR